MRRQAHGAHKATLASVNDQVDVLASTEQHRHQRVERELPQPKN
jgi:hypothetical protein